MDHAFLSRSIWTNDTKFLQHPTDLYTSVVVTRTIPGGTSFGPCVLQNTFYDTIAFIAQKSCDKRTKSYVFRVDPEAMRNSALVLSWLRLVQAARNGEEQNTEAFLKAGQLYVRTTRDVRPEEELLVWYDHELSHLLSFAETATRGPNQEFQCVRCDQTFRHEFPFLAHCRFLCVQMKGDAHKQAEIKKPRRVTDFHNIARDLEHKKSGASEDAVISSRKRKCEDVVNPKGRKSVLLEKTNISNDNNITPQTKDYEQIALDASSSILKLKTLHLEFKNDAVANVAEAAKGGLTREKAADQRLDAGETSGVHLGSAFSLIAPNGHGEQKSAFFKPSKRPAFSESTLRLPTAPTPTSSHREDMSEVFGSRTVAGYTRPGLVPSNILSGEFVGPQTVATPQVALGGGAFHYAPEHWSRGVAAPLQAAPSLTVLPPSFTSFGVSVQNWCAKCNLSFRMTSDLVFHMRSHHKKEFAVESHVRRRREEKLTCPICHEYFRERHHLSRHMTSHN